MQANRDTSGFPMFASTWRISDIGAASMRTCSACKRSLPKDAFRKYAGRSSDGLRPICKECQRRYEAQWRVENVARLVEARKKRAAKEKAYRQEYDAVNRGRLLVMEAKRRAARWGLPFDLEKHISRIEARIQVGICEMTGLPFDFHNKGSNWNSPSMDRIDPKKGYVYENIRIVCFAMNAALGHWGEMTLRTIMSAWLERK